MGLDTLQSPLSFLRGRLDTLPQAAITAHGAGEFKELAGVLAAEQEWWKGEGAAIGDAIDRAGTPWLRMFDAAGKRVDEICYPREYQTILKRGYRAGVVWRALEEKSLLSTYLLMYTISFYDPGVCCPYTVSLGTTVPLAKYGSAELQSRFLPHLLRKDDSVWQGATWMTEIAGGSDLGAGVKTVAQPNGAGHENSWLLTGEKYFTSNAGAELAVVAARPEGAAQGPGGLYLQTPGGKAGVRGLALFLVPRYRRDGSLNYFIRRLKDKIATRSVPTGEVELKESEGYLLGSPGDNAGIYPILEVLNLSRVANSVVSVALAQRAMAGALRYAEKRVAFGKRILEHPLLRLQFEERAKGLRSAFALAWESVRLLNEVWMEKPPYSERYHLFRLIAHLAKYWTAEFAVDTAKWAMEVHGGLGVLAEFGVERWLREAMILAIWEGTAHRQVLDALEVMERKQAHRMLFERLAGAGGSEGTRVIDEAELRELESAVERHLKLPQEEKEAGAESLIRRLAVFTADGLADKSEVT
jgi:alkylation response protein AidB-like acyl-CoA dehydrogenase